MLLRADARAWYAKVDIEHNLVSLENKQLAASQTPPSSTAKSKTSATAVDKRVGGLLKKDKGAGKKVLGMLTEAADERKAQEVADGKVPGHLSKGFKTPEDKRQHYEEEEKKQARELEDEVERHAAIISSGAAVDEEHDQDVPHVGKARRSTKTAAAARGKAWSDGYVAHKGYVQGGWRALAEKSKRLAHPTGASSRPGGAAAAARSSSSARSAPRALGHPRSSPPAKAVVAQGKRSAQHRRRPRARRKGGAGESWETEIRDDSLPIVCGLPLLAEASGIDCNTVKRVHKIKGQNQIAKDLKEVGLGDDEIGTGDRKKAKLGPFKRGGALGIPHKGWGRQLAPKRSFGAGSAIQALGYTSPAQYEKHTLLATIAKEEDTIERLRMKMSAQNGGIKVGSSGYAASPLAEAALERGVPPQQLSQRQRLEDEVAREQVAFPPLLCSHSRLRCACGGLAPRCICPDTCEIYTYLRSGRWQLWRRRRLGVEDGRWGRSL